MGLTISSLLARLFSPKQVRILMVGLDAAGKTTILYNLKLAQVINSIPTIGFNVETLEYKNITFTVWDIGGQDKIRRLWRHYYHNTQGIIFVIDAADHLRINEAKNELYCLLNEYELKDSILLVFSNKQDLTNAMKIEEIVEKLDLSSLKNRNWFVQNVSATQGYGLYEGLDWLARELCK